MSQRTAFHRPERAPYELGHLLRALPRDLDGAKLTAEQINMADAAGHHASIVTSTILSGLESMGRIMWSAGVNQRNPVESDDFANVGMLVAGLAVQLQFLSEFQSEVDECIRHRSKTNSSASVEGETA